MSAIASGAAKLLDAKADVNTLNGFQSSSYTADGAGYIEIADLYSFPGVDPNMRYRGVP
jgi:uncharacterized membrane protein